MALFPTLEVEKSVQLSDKTRLDASKSFVSKGATAISILTIKPGADESAISVFNATDSTQWFLDWKFSAFKIDVDSTNNKLDFNEGGSELTATISSGTYTASSLLVELKTQLEAVGSGTYTLEFDINEKLNIESTVAFQLLPVSGSNRDNSILPSLGFLKDTSTSASQLGNIVDGWNRKITLTAGDGSTTATEDKYIKVYSPTGDGLYSNDSDLTSHEADILKYVPKGRSSFLNVHRRCQELIIAWLDEKGYTNVFDEKFTKFDIKDIEEVRQWSTFMALKLIFRSISNAVDDVFSEKSKEYSTLEAIARNRAVLRIDVDKDGVVDTFEDLSISSGVLVRR